MNERTRCMVVDDEPDIRLLVRSMIEQEAHRFSMACDAENGERAIELVDECDPEVIILDEFMPDMTGLEAAEKIFMRRPGQRFVLFSAYIGPELRRRAADLGIGVCLSKTDVDLLPEAVAIAAAAASPGLNAQCREW